MAPKKPGEPLGGSPGELKVVGERFYYEPLPGSVVSYLASARAA